jgi:hypothetical protein
MGRPCSGERASWRAEGWVGGIARAVGIIPATPYSDSSLRPCLGQGAFQGKESVLADSGRKGEITARVWIFNETESHDRKTKKEGGGFGPPPS